MRTVEGFLKGLELAARLEELKDIANENHLLAQRNYRGFLEHARKVGEALQEAYERLGRRGKWGKWVRANFAWSARLSRQYRQIHRYWNDPRLAAARAAGFELKSVQAVLKILRSEHPKPAGWQPAADATAESRRVIRRDFARRLKELQPEEISAYYWNLDHFWELMYADLKATVCGIEERDFYATGEDDGPYNPKPKPVMAAYN